MSRKNWRDNVEIIGIFAIVVSLAALVYELRQTQEALIAATYQERAFDAIAESVLVSDSEFLVPILVATDSGRNREALAHLDEIDRLRLRNFMRARMADWDNEYYQYQHGYLDEDFFLHTTKPAIKSWAPRWRALGVPEAREAFRLFVDEVLADSQVELIGSDRR